MKISVPHHNDRLLESSKAFFLYLVSYVVYVAKVIVLCYKKKGVKCTADTTSSNPCFGI